MKSGQLKEIVKGVLLEYEFKTYRARVKVKFKPDNNINSIADYVRSIRGVLTVTQESHDFAENIAIFKIKILSLTDSMSSFKEFKDRAMKNNPEVLRVDVARKTIEEL